MRPGTLIEREQRKTGARSISELCDLAAAGLVAMLDPERQIFCDVYNRTEKGMTRERLSPRYTMMTLLGLNRYERSGRHSPVAIAPVLNALLDDTAPAIWVCFSGRARSWFQNGCPRCITKSARREHWRAFPTGGRVTPWKSHGI